TSSYVDLTPAGASQSDLNAMHGSIQAGSAFMDLSGASKDHAALWSGTAESFVDLHPAGASSSSIYGYDGLHEVGYATVDGKAHAGLWSGTAESFIDLNGTNTGSWAFGVAGSWQVGQFFDGPNAQAGLWHGTPESLINLTPYLGADYNNAQAFGAWLDGTTLYIVGTGSGPAANSQAFLWTVVIIPEPSPLFQTAAAAALFAIVARWKKAAKTGH
ncbi:MAG: hypothetical protein NTV22_15675, partial [bacterium]|nr:hypothetical protein [bacterium]